MFLAGSAGEGCEEAAQHLPGRRGRLQRVMHSVFIQGSWGWTETGVNPCIPAYVECEPCCFVPGDF